MINPPIKTSTGPVSFEWYVILRRLCDFCELLVGNIITALSKVFIWLDSSGNYLRDEKL
jgi:hypothetical protein